MDEDRSAGSHKDKRLLVENRAKRFLNLRVGNFSQLYVDGSSPNGSIGSITFSIFCPHHFASNPIRYWKIAATENLDQGSRNPMKLSTLLFAWLAVFGFHRIQASDWPQWRGVARDGRWVEPGLDQTPPEGGFTVLWHARVGFGFSSPIVADGKVYVTDSQFRDGTVSERILCLDSQTGRTLWIHTFGGEYAEWALDPKNAFGPRPTPLVHQGRVFVLGARGQLWCLDSNSGSVVWNRQLPNKSKDSVFTASPLIEEGLLILSNDGGPEGTSVIALDARTGEDRWKEVSDPPTMGSPVVIEAAGRRQLMVWTTHAVQALNPKTGALLWLVRHPGGLTYPVATPVWEGANVLIGGLLLELDASNPGAKVLWPEAGPPPRDALSETSLPVLQSSHVYTANLKGELVCLDARDGKVVWRTNSITKTSSGAAIQITPVGTRHLLLNDRGELIWAQLDPTGYRELSRHRFLLPTSPMGPSRNHWTPPAFANGCIFARNDEELLCARLIASPGTSRAPNNSGPTVIELWPAQAPDEIAEIGPERLRMSPTLDRTKVEVTESTRLITGVSKPTLTIYRPPANRDTGTAIVICPGGGYWDLYWQLEGEEVAEWLNSMGVTGIILKYRVPRRPGEVEREPAIRPLQDAQRAIRLVRSRSAEWGWTLRHLGIMGFSAGGHLAFATATQFDHPAYQPVDAIDSTSPRPDFAIPVYSGYLKAQDQDVLASGIHVSPGAPPCFLVHGAMDIISPPEGTRLAYQALRRVGVAAELHLFDGAAHDFGVRTNAGPAARWTQRCEGWLRSRGWLETR